MRDMSAALSPRSGLLNHIRRLQRFVASTFSPHLEYTCVNLFNTFVSCLGVYSTVARILFSLYYTPTIGTQPHVVYLPVNKRLLTCQYLYTAY